jgi:predicted transcriptional regulator
MIKEYPLNLKDLQTRMKENGLDLPTSTVYRAINNLQAAGVIERRNGEISLTPRGIFFAEAVDCIKKLMDFEYIELATDFLLSLPSDLRFGVHHLSEFEKIDFMDLRTFCVNTLRGIRRWGIYIDRIADPELFHIMIERRLNGATEKVISAEDVIFQKIDAEIAALKIANLGKEEVRKIEELVEIRVKTLPIQMGVIDGEVGVIMLVQGKRFSPFFVTKNRRAIRWLENVFAYYWDTATPLEEYIEGGKEGYISKIVGAL